LASQSLIGCRLEITVA